MQHHGAPQSLDRLDLDARRRKRHDDDCGRAQAPRGKRDTLSMVTRRGTDHSATHLLRRQLCDLVVGAAELEAEHGLLVFALQENLIAEPARQLSSRLQRSFHGHVVHTGREDPIQVFVEVEHQR
ncbi:hypothetical protein D3C85_1551140 [compost metagenome]